jgi:deoxyribodipyrimidine photo-lyase
MQFCCRAEANLYYMRMYWAKKILEWSRTPAEAHQIAVQLNDKYELDGRDPHADIAWAIVGKFDRPWFERPIFGQIRYRSGESTGRIFDSRSYMLQNVSERAVLAAPQAVDRGAREDVE